MQAVLPPPFTAPPLPPRNPMFVRAPSELVMLATPWRGDVPAGGLIVQEKLDGIRAVMVEGQLLTRAGVPIQGVDHILADLARLQREFDIPMVFDGELVVDGTLAATKRHFERAGRDGDGGRLHVFDALPWWEWGKDDCPDVLGVRLGRLRTAAAAAGMANVSLVPWVAGGSVASVEREAAAVWARGGEGLVVKEPASLYRRTRSATWSKVKRPPTKRTTWT